MKTKYVILLVSFSFIACNNKKEMVLYFKNSSVIKEKRAYVDKRDTSSYYFYSYYFNGKLKETFVKNRGILEGEKVKYYINGKIYSKVSFIEGKAEGIVQVFDENENLILYNTYKNDKQNGLYIKFDKNRNAQQELLNINDSPIISVIKGPDTLENKNIFGISFYYYNHNDSLFSPIGSLIYNYEHKNKVKYQKYCTYFETIAKDTVQYGDSLRITIISNIGLHQGHHISLFLGEIDKFFNFVDSSKVRIFKSNSNILSFTLSKKDYYPGINLITGKLRVYKDDEEITQKYMLFRIDNVPYIFFRQFFVVDNKSDPANLMN